MGVIELKITLNKKSLSLRRKNDWSNLFVEMNKDSKIYLAGHRGLVGSAILKNLQEKGYHNIVTGTHNELDFYVIAISLYWAQSK